MHLRLLLGPAGSGKTFQCISEARRKAADAPGGLPLLIVAPKQTTYLLERQLLSDGSLPGYSRLHVVSFERFAWLILQQLNRPLPEMLDEEGRVMVLRSLLARGREELKLFRASARLTGFAQQLSAVLHEFQRNQLDADGLERLAKHLEGSPGLAGKLQDFGTLLRRYYDWLKGHQLQDSDLLLASATAALTEAAPVSTRFPKPTGRRKPSARSNSPAQLDMGFDIPTMAPRDGHSAGELPTTLLAEEVWLDSFAEFSAQELELLAAFFPRCQQATVTFCVDRVPHQFRPAVQGWSMVERAFADCRQRFAAIPGAILTTQVLVRDLRKSRFDRQPALARLERLWSVPQAQGSLQDSTLAASDSLQAGVTAVPEASGATPTQPVRSVVCSTPEVEAVFAAREILRAVRAGMRYREISVMVRSLEGYHEALQRVFSRYTIPFFMDRRESVAHHPLAELIRSALRTVAYDWATEDWFAALKTGLVPVNERAIDRLENEALARGWEGKVWLEPIAISGDAELSQWLAQMQEAVVPPFRRLALGLAASGGRPTGLELASCIRALWHELRVAETLESWASVGDSSLDPRLPASVHGSVLEQLEVWLGNVEMAFAKERLALREWLPILEAGLANLSVGVIPPALDQVLIGSIERSRNPDIRMTFVLGLNEGIFPAPPGATTLLTENERLELEKRSVRITGAHRQHFSREKFLGYIACTRARESLVLTSALADSTGAPLMPSPLLQHVKRLLPGITDELFQGEINLSNWEHPSELKAVLLKELPRSGEAAVSPLAELVRPYPLVWNLVGGLHGFAVQNGEDVLRPETAAALYGPVLRTSVSRLEQFAACPFRFFINSGLRAEERKLFELDLREQGSFQHEVLALFHQQLQKENKRWRDITPAEARERVGQLGKLLSESYRDGLLRVSEQTRFLARVMTESLQDFAETLVAWMREQYRFDPVQVELSFGEQSPSPAWTVNLADGKRLQLQGRIDRVDLYRDQESTDAWCVVVDYKSSQKHLDDLLIAHGLQLQLLTYLNVVRRWPDPHKIFGAKRLIPAGVFYVNLKGKYETGRDRSEALAAPEEARRAAYRHLGRFDSSALSLLDARTNVGAGDQFNYRLKRDGTPHKNSADALGSAEFADLLEQVERGVKRMGDEIFSGHIRIDPYRKGTLTACVHCDYRSICRVDPWIHPFRALRAGAAAEAADEVPA